MNRSARSGSAGSGLLRSSTGFPSASTTSASERSSTAASRIGVADGGRSAVRASAAGSIRPRWMPDEANVSSTAASGRSRASTTSIRP
ncbi:MAG: hypothetical protein B7Z61_10830 [Acidobacteria bacterium 37-71-11]|nr:MAG: hypothetical protein B7Z61_10830 [Acidobacteria bacterium 37-71-11]